MKFSVLAGMSCRLRTIGLYASAVFICSCASIMHGTHQDVGISSNPTGASVSVDGQLTGKTPVIANLRRKDNHIVRMELAGYKPYETTLTRSASGWVWGNIAFGGLIGLAVDAISGGFYNLSPEQVTGQLYVEENSASAGSVGTGVTRDAIPSVARSATTPPTQPVQVNPRVIGASFGPSTVGLSVLRVDKESVAARAGLRPGDVITHINGRNIVALYWENAVALLTSSDASVYVRLFGNEERVLTFPQ